MAKAFFGGVHPNDMKAATNEKAIEQLAPPKQVIIPMSQHFGAPCTPIVQKGDHVKIGQKIGEFKGLGAPIHASVSGTVAAVEPRPYSMGGNVMSVVIDNDFQDEISEEVVAPADPDLLSVEEMIEIVKEGMTFQEAFDEVLQLRKDYVESTENEGDQYHTINLNLESGETEKKFPSEYYGTLLLNKDNYGINVQSLSDEDCSELMKVRGKIADMASDWYGGAVEGDVVLKDIMSIFELNNIQIDISEYQKEKEVDLMLFNVLSYIDSVIIAIQRKMLTSPIVGVDLANGEENENAEEKE